MNPLELLKNINYTVEEYNLVKQIGFEYWHTNILNQKSIPFSAGFGITKNISRKIAYSEFLERTKFNELKKSNVDTQKKWGFNILDTGCGFASGFNEKNTILRSVGESVERWALSNWIDNKAQMDMINKKQLYTELEPVSRWFADQFDDIFFFKKDILIFLNNNPVLYTVCATVGFINNGAYLGSSSVVKNSSDLLWQHSLLESFRHLLLVKNTIETNCFPDNRVRFFSSNAQIALQQIAPSKPTNNWILPEICLHNCEYFNDWGFYLARTVLKNWRPWKEGSIERFLY